MPNVCTVFVAPRSSPLRSVSVSRSVLLCICALFRELLVGVQSFSSDPSFVSSVPSRPVRRSIPLHSKTGAHNNTGRARAASPQVCGVASRVLPSRPDPSRSVPSRPVPSSCARGGTIPHRDSGCLVSSRLFSYRLASPRLRLVLCCALLSAPERTRSDALITN